MGTATQFTAAGSAFPAANPVPSILQVASLEVKQFVAAHRLTSDVQQAEHLAQTNFPEGASISLEVVQDRESEEQWLVLRVTLSATPDEVLRCYAAFVEKWIGTASPRAIDRITLSYAVV